MRKGTSKRFTVETKIDSGKWSAYYDVGFWLITIKNILRSVLR